jgi:hydroxymethylpyrimidine/phosphomethylpyrimidine kinase
MVATSGAQLLPTEAVSQLRKSLLGRATVLTPNIPEARLILEDAGESVGEIHGVGDLDRMAQAVGQLGPEWVLLKGGHLPLKTDLTVGTSSEDKKVVVNVLHGNGQTIHITSEYQDSPNTHGTGCSLACTTPPDSNIITSPVH